MEIHANSYMEAAQYPALLPCGQKDPDNNNMASDEDWSQIDDMVMRRRVQNRAAQRRYRRKMKSQSPMTEIQNPMSNLTTASIEETGENQSSSTMELQWPTEIEEPNGASEQAPSLPLNLEHCMAGNDNAMDTDILTYIRSQRNTLPPTESADGYHSSALMSPRRANDHSGHLNRSGPGGRGPEIALLSPQRELDLTFCAGAMPAGAKRCTETRNAGRLIQRIHKHLDDLEFLYDLGVEMELMREDETMPLYLKTLKKRFAGLVA